jgi:Tol biopolymer transport system component
LLGEQTGQAEVLASKARAVPAHQAERHLKNIHQLTVGRQNAEGYFSFNGTKLIFQSTNNWMKDTYAATLKPADAGLGCYQMCVMDLEGDTVRLVSTGSGAEATVSPDGKTIVWTSVKEGDLDLYAINLDGSKPRRLTSEIGYDGGAFFSPDSQRIVYRAAHPTDQAEIDKYKVLLTQSLVEPGQLEIFVMNGDGSGQRAETSNGASNFSPFYFSDGKRIILSSKIETKGEGGRPSFHLYAIGEDGQALERLTFDGQFNSFPMFSPDGKSLVWVSDRQAKSPGEFNVFLADWVP